MTVDGFVADARHVENRVPAGANWNGSEEMYYTAEEFAAARAGTPLPKKPAPKTTKKTATKPAAASGAAPPARADISPSSPRHTLRRSH